jgi:DNA-binding NtrC family response regulator
MQHRVLLYDTDPVLSQNCLNALEKNLFRAQKVDFESEIFEILAKQNFEMVILPITERGDIEKISRIKKQKLETHIIVTSQDASPQFVVECIRYGASHFWHKQDNLDTFINVVAEVGNRICKSSFSKYEHHYGEFIGRHPKILDVYDLVFKIKESDCNVLITGESGTGKEVIARAIHQLSTRKNKPLVAVNCGAIPINLLESELFGHVKGAFTGASQNRVGRFQLAQNGSLFLDEIGDLSFDLQAKLLRAIQHKVYEPVGAAYSLTLDARIIAATNQDLEKLVSEKRFREDLFYRLKVFFIEVPSLRERKEDIRGFIQYFIQSFSKKFEKTVVGIDTKALETLERYSWPGNIRELENVISRAVVIASSGIIFEDDLPSEIFEGLENPVQESNENILALEEIEKNHIQRVLKLVNYQRGRAAQLLGINRVTLYRKATRYCINLTG